MIVALLVGCVLDEPTFRDALDAEVCAWEADCYTADEQQCLTDALASRDADPGDCAYDPRAAQDCVEDWERLPCPGQEGEPFTFPASCDEVWSCP